MKALMDERPVSVLVRFARAAQRARALRQLPRAATLLLLATLAGCASAPIPDVAYYRLPVGERAAATSAAPVSREPIVVDVLIADGMYGSQAILYQTASEAPVKQYHYQLWQDPPGRMLQRRLISRMRTSGLAPVVTDRLPTSIAATRVSGVIERFERFRNADESWGVAIQVELRADRGLDDLPLLLKTYDIELETDNATIQAAVRAFSRGVNQVVDEFRDDLAAAYTAARTEPFDAGDEPSRP